jgi:hypothetical protein
MFNVLRSYTFFERREWIKHILDKPCLSVHQSVNLIQLENPCTDMDEIWYGRYAIEGYPKKIYLSVSYNRQ